MFGGEAERYRQVEGIEQAHLPVEPPLGAGAETTGPAKARIRLSPPVVQRRSSARSGLLAIWTGFEQPDPSARSD